MSRVDRPGEAGQTSTVHVVIIGEIAVCLVALARWLGEHHRIHVTGTLPIGERLSPGRAELAADVALVIGPSTAQIPSLIRDLRAATPGIRVVAVGSAWSDAAILDCVTAGALGLLGKNASPEQLVETLHSAGRAEAHFAADVAPVLRRHLAEADRADPRVTSLTVREREIAQMLALGLSNKEIAKKLSISVPTVKTHIHHVLQKLNVRRRAAVIGLLRPDPGLLPALAPAGPSDDLQVPPQP